MKDEKIGGMKMARRKSITKKLRFEVFKRDSFTCQYCGRMAPDVVLEVDHVNPVANGGDNDIMNLITSCFDCNRGKGKRKLTERDEIKKQQEQLKALNEKREQLKMVLEWREELAHFENEQVQEVESLFYGYTESSFTTHGNEKVKKWIKEFGLIEVLDCTEISIAQYFNENDKKSISKTFDYIPRICNMRKRQKENPMLQKQNYIKGILKNRLHYMNERKFWSIICKMKEEHFEYIKEVALECENWTDFVDYVSDYYDYLGDDNG